MDAIYLSIVIAAYNAEKTIERAIKSIINQNVGSYEIVIVDDGSSDGTVEIINNVKERNPNIDIRLISIINSGVANARNIGIKNAVGKYITFMDSDDYYDADVLSTFYRLSIQSPIVDLWKFSAIEKYYVDGVHKYDRICSTEEFSSNNKKEIMEKILDLESIPLFGYVWNGFFKKDIIEANNIQFSSEYIMEDFMFSILYSKYINSMTCIPNIYYVYFIETSTTSLSKKYEPKYFEMYYLKVQTLLDIIQLKLGNDTELYSKLSKLFTRYIYSALDRLSSEYSYTDKVNWLRSLYIMELYVILQPYMSVNKSIIGLLTYLLKYRHTNSIIVVSQFISYIRNHFKVLFARLK